MKRSCIGPKTYESALATRIASQDRQREKAFQKRAERGTVPEGLNLHEERSLESRTALRSRSSLKRGKQMKRSTKRLKAGKKVKAWESERCKLKRIFAVAGITTCELKYEGCAIDDYLGFAHAAKRRKLSAEDLKHVILACNFCHDRIEILPPEKMRQIVDGTVQRREVQP